MRVKPKTLGLILVLAAFCAIALIDIKPVKAQASHLLINEFGVQPTDNEQMELYNPTGSAIDLTNWVLSDGEADLTLSGTIDAGGYKVVDVNPPLELANYADDLYLEDPDDNVVDSVAYSYRGGCPDPEYDWTAARAPNGVDTDDDSADWTVDTTPTFGSANDAPAPNLGGVDVVINEVLPNNASGEEEFVELYNKGASAVDIGGWFITDGDDGYTVPSGTTIPAGGFWVLRGSTWVAQAIFFDDLYNSGDNVYLFTDDWVKVDQIGWSTNHGVGRSLGRIYDGKGWFYAYDDPTLLESGWNEGKYTDNGTPGTTNEGNISPDDILPSIGKPSQEPSPTQVMPDENVTVSVNVTDNVAVRNVTLSYRTDSGEWIDVNMSKTTGNIYTGVILGFSDGTDVSYQIIAYDIADNFAIEDNNGEYYVYTVIPEFPIWSSVLVMLLLLATIMILLKRGTKKPSKLGFH